MFVCLDFYVKKKHSRLLALGKASLIMGYETIRATVNENFCFVKEIEQGPDSDKVQAGP